MILGGYTFPWRPTKQTPVRYTRNVIGVRTLDSADIYRYPSRIIGQRILLEWDWMSETQYQMLRSMYVAGGDYVFDPLTPFDPMQVPGPTLNGYPKPGFPWRYYHGNIEEYNRVVTTPPAQYFEVGKTWDIAYTPYPGYFGGWTDRQHGTITASGDYWCEVNVTWAGNGGTLTDMEQPGDPYIGNSGKFFYVTYGSKVRIAPLVQWKSPYLEQCRYPDPTYPNRCWYRNLTGQAIAPGDYLYGIQSYLDMEVTAVGAGYFDWIPYVPNYSPLLHWGERLYSWYKDTEAYVDAVGNADIPTGVPPPPLEPFSDTFNVRILSLDGKLFPTVGYDFAYRKNVALVLTIRGVV